MREARSERREERGETCLSALLAVASLGVCLNPLFLAGKARDCRHANPISPLASLFSPLKMATYDMVCKTPEPKRTPHLPRMRIPLLGWNDWVGRLCVRSYPKRDVRASRYRKSLLSLLCSRFSKIPVPKSA